MIGCDIVHPHFMLYPIDCKNMTNRESYAAERNYIEYLAKFCFEINHYYRSTFIGLLVMRCKTLRF